MKILESMKRFILLFGLLLSLVLVGKTQNATQIKFDRLAYTVDALIEKRAFEEALALVNSYDLNELSNEDKVLIYRLTQKIYAPENIGNFDSSQHYIEQMLPLMALDSSKVKRLLELGNIQFLKGNVATANQTFQEVFENMALLPSELDKVQLLSKLSLTHRQLGQNEEQLIFLEQLNEMASRSTDNLSKGIAYSELLNYYSTKGDFKKVEELLTSFKTVASQMKDSVSVSKAARLVAFYYSNRLLNNADSLNFYLLLAKNHLNDKASPIERYTLNFELAAAALEQENYKKVIALCKEGIKGLEQIGMGNSTNIQFGHTYIANALLRSNQLEEAEIYSRKILELARFHKNDLAVLQTLRLVIEVLKRQERDAELGAYYEEMLSLKDSIAVKYNKAQVSEAETRLGLVLKEQELENQNLRLEQQKRQQNWYLGLIALLSLILIGAFWAYRRIVRNRKVIAEQKEDLQQSLTEKEFLLKEIHHRVKNNLQIISSLLDKQARTSADKALKQMIHEGQDRIQSMALIHQNLYQSENLSNIEIQKYIQELTTNISSSQRAAEKNIEINLDVEPIQLDIDRAIPLGLILNELLTNSFKHGFKEQEGGQVKVQFQEKADQAYELNFSDTGKGLPKDFDLSKAKSLGLNLVNGLVQQLDGVLDVESSRQGTRFSIQF